MAGKHARDDESLKDDRPDEPGREDEDELLKDDEDNRSTAMEVQTDSAKSSDTLESTLMKLNDNMSTVTHSMSTMQQAILRLANSQRPSKRQRMDELSDSDDDSIASPDEDSDSLLENVKLARPGSRKMICLTRSQMTSTQMSKLIKTYQISSQKSSIRDGRRN